MRKRKIVFEKGFFNLLQWAIRALAFSLAGIMLSAGNLTYICIRDNIQKLLPYSVILTLASTFGTFIAVYFGFFVEYEEK